MHASSSGSEAGAGWSLLEAAPDAMLVVGNEGRIEFLNAQTERMFGYLRAELLGEPLEKLLPARCRNRHAHDVSTFLAAPRARPMGDGRELYGQHQDGREFPVEISLSPVSVSGTPLVIAAIRDITARKQVEEDLRRSREDLEITLQSIGDGVIVTGLDGRVVRINPTAQELTGWTAEAAVGQALEKVFPIFDEATRAPLENPVRKVLECGRTVDLANHTLLRARDGFERPIADSGAPVRDQSGRVRGVVLVFRDQTEEAAAERRIRQSEETLRELLCNIPDFILTLDAQGIVQFVNHGGPPLGREGVIGQSWLAYVSPDQHAVPQSALQQVLATGEPVTYEVTTTGTDGSQIWSAHHIGPIRHEGNIVGAVVVARDVTEKRRIEA
ncbi:MAG: hypothetical protein RL685_3545, partial [Pseudomonadota bacterium]